MTKLIKIAISISKSKEIYWQSEVFGRSTHFLFFNTITKEEKIISNPFCIEIGGEGIQSVQFLIKHSIDVLITKEIGINPLRFLNSANIKTYLYKGSTTKEALRLFSQNKLSELKLLDYEYDLN